MSEQVKRIDRQLMYKGKIVDFYRDKMQFEDGNSDYWDFLEHHNGAAAVVPVMEDGRILMVRQYRNSVDRYTLEIPAGGLNGKQEPPIECAARELEEETGYRSDCLEPLISIRSAIAFCDELVEVFVANQLIPSKQHLDEGEYIDIKPYEVDELKDMIFTGEIQDSKTIGAIMAYIVKYQRA